MSTAVKICYNPYYVKTEISINGHEQKHGSEYYELANGNKRLQDWIDEFFEKLVSNGSDLDFEIQFIGTALDGDDVIKAAKDCEKHPQNQRDGVSIKVSVVPKSSREDKLKTMQTLWEEAKHSPIPDFVSPPIEKGFMRALGEKFEINVIAPMSSGKSTVINALLGTDLLPSMNQACTAAIARIENDPQKRSGSFMGRRFGKDDELLDDWREVNEYRKAQKERVLKAWNGANETHYIEISGHIPAFTTSQGTNYVFIDTPGPNSHGTNHREIMLSALQGKTPSMILYIFNAQNQCSDDDHSLLTIVSEEMKKNGRAAQDRFLFIANQMDALDPDVESHEEALERWKTYLEGQFGIMNPVIIPVSAKFAKCLRIERNYGLNSLSRYEQSDYMSYKAKFSTLSELNMLQYMKGKINSSCYQRLENAYKNAKNQEEKFEIMSGIPIVEALLRDFLEKHVISSKLKDGVDCLQEVLTANKIAEKEIQLYEVSQEKLCEANEKYKKFMEKYEEANRGFGFRQKLKDFSYAQSEETKSGLAKIYDEHAKFQTALEALPDSMKENEAKKTYKSFMEKGALFSKMVMDILSEALEHDYSSVLKNWEQKYNEFVTRLIKENWEDCNIPALIELQKNILQIPSIEELVEKYGEKKPDTKRVTHRRKRSWKEKLWDAIPEDKFSLSSWGKYWDNLSEDYAVTHVDVPITVTKITKESIINDVVPKLEDFTTKSVEAFDSCAKKSIDSARDALLNKMQQIDDILAIRGKELESAANSKSVAQEKAENAKKRMEWIKAFEPRLTSILELDGE